MIKMDRTKTLNKRLGDSKTMDHATDVAILMANQDSALRLHLDNLILTYGISAVREMIDRTSLDLIKKSKKAG